MGQPKVPLALKAIWKALVFLLLLPPLFSIPSVRADISTNNIVSDATTGGPTLGTVAGQKLIVDSTGRHILVYVDQSGRLGLSFANTDPAVNGSWSAPVKSSAPTVSYGRAAAVLLSLTSLRVIAEGGSAAGTIVDVAVTLTRDGSSNIVGASFAAPVALDSSGLAANPSAILAHNGDVLAVWTRTGAASSRVLGTRWISGVGWRNFANTGTGPQDIVVDSSDLGKIFPSIVERADNNKLYVFGNRVSSSSPNLVFNSASFDGSNWSWGPQNLTFETNAARGIDDTPSARWDPTTTTVVVIYDITGTNEYGVIRLDSGDAKTHIDTPNLPITNNEWGLLQVDTSNGDLYIFFLDTASGASNGMVKFTRRSSSVWSTTLGVIDADTDNVGLNGIPGGSGSGVEVVYAAGLSAPVAIRFARATGPPPGPHATSLSLASSPDPSEVNETISLSGTLMDAALGSGAPTQLVLVQMSIDNLTWTPVATATTSLNGQYAVDVVLTSPGLYYFRSLFNGTVDLLATASPIDLHMVNAVTTFTFASANVTSDAALQTTSIATGGGRKLIEDSYGKLIIVYVDTVGRLAVTWANGDPTSPGAWSTPIRTPTPPDGYSRPAAAIDSAGRLRIFAEGGNASGILVDITVFLARDGSGNLLGGNFSAPVVLDPSGQARFASATAAHNGNIFLVWSFKTVNASYVRGLRWIQGTGWRNFANTGPGPDNIIVDAADTSRINPAIIERLDNDNVYLIGNRGEVSPSSMMVFNKATFTGTDWTWGTQNLAYETNASRGSADEPSVAWDPRRNLVVVVYDLSGLNRFGVIQIDSSDSKRHMDTPDLTGFTNNDWGTIEVDPLVGDYYLFAVNTPVGVERGTVLFTRWTGTIWNATMQVLDGGSDNEGINAKIMGTLNGIDIIYGKGTTVPTQVRFVRVTVHPVLRDTSLSLSASPRSVRVGRTVNIRGSLTETTTGIGLANRLITVQRSSDGTNWTTLMTLTTDQSGSYSAQTSFSQTGRMFLRAVFDGDTFHNPDVSSTVSIRVR